MRNILNNERGATTVIVAISIIWIVAMCALVVDVSVAMIEKQKLQSAVDAATLAAAQELPDTTAARLTAEEYVTLNGFSANDITVTFNDAGTEVEVQGTNPVQFFFAPAIGMDSVTLDTSARAELSAEGYHAAFDYAVFSGSSTIDLVPNGEGMRVNGDMHTNDNFRLIGTNVKINGAVEAVGSVRTNGNDLHIKSIYPNHSHIDMPDYSEIIREQAIASGTFYSGDQTFNGATLNVANSMYVDGDITINGGNFAGRGFLYATGSITFNGSTVYQEGNDAVAVYTETGTIRLNGNDMRYQGIFYAPNNEIRINGNNMRIDGRLIGDSVEIIGTDITISATIKETRMLPKDSAGSVKLIN